MSAAPALAQWSGPLTPETAPAIAERLHELLAGRLFAVARTHSSVSPTYGPIFGLSAAIARLDPALEAKGIAVKASTTDSSIWLSIFTTDQVYIFYAARTAFIAFDPAGASIRYEPLFGNTVFWRFSPRLEAL